MKDQQPYLLNSPNRYKEYVVTGQLVAAHDRPDVAVLENREKDKDSEQNFLSPPEVLTIEEVASRSIEGIDTAKVLGEMADMGPEARLFLQLREGKAIRYEIFDDPRICLDIHRGAVIENLKEKPKDVSGWRTNEFFIDIKGCLGDECGRCAIVCPENAIHLVGKGKGSFHEIDPLACKGCFICWVECVRTAADCILVDGKTFDPKMRAKHFGE
ncbi:MAG: hypothetical protein HY695_18280 [Deltaproteobacteria bacterium]|nr:hypothetical protein [Deltaproteobacteria bacterium]